MSRRSLICSLLLICPLLTFAQVGDHRSTLAIGVNGGYNLSSVRFLPKVPQGLEGGYTGGLSMRYTVEKYFTMLASVVAELNYGQVGWRENIRDIKDNPVINGGTGKPEEYSRKISYIQLPFLTHLSWGRETKGVSVFVNAGPQFGYYLSESTKTNFDWANRNMHDRANRIVAQDTMAVEHKFDFGIAAGVGLEYSHPKAGHFLLSARYYYGLGNLYGDSKRDYFASSNLGVITIKLTYLFDLRRYHSAR